MWVIGVVNLWEVLVFVVCKFIFHHRCSLCFIRCKFNIARNRLKYDTCNIVCHLFICSFIHLSIYLFIYYYFWHYCCHYLSLLLLPIALLFLLSMLLNSLINNYLIVSLINNSLLLLLLILLCLLSLLLTYCNNFCNILFLFYLLFIWCITLLSDVWAKHGAKGGIFWPIQPNFHSRIRLSPGKVDMIIIDMYGKSSLSEWIYENTWAHTILTFMFIFNRKKSFILLIINLLNCR